MADLSFHEVVRLRHSCRGFLGTEVPDDIIKSVLSDAQLAPSNCNTQPWNVHVISGETLQSLTLKLIEAHQKNEFSPDFSFDPNDFEGNYKDRLYAQGKKYYEGLGISRDDRTGRDEANLRNYKFFNAPHAALLFMPSVGDNVRVAGDIGMYGQTLLLSLTAHGLAGVPQTVLGFFPDVIRKHLGIPGDMKMLFGISFGYEDKTKQPIFMDREEIESNVTFHK